MTTRIFFWIFSFAWLVACFGGHEKIKPTGLLLLVSRSRLFYFLLRSIFFFGWSSGGLLGDDQRARLPCGPVLVVQLLHPPNELGVKGVHVLLRRLVRLHHADWSVSNAAGGKGAFHGHGVVVGRRKKERMCGAK